MSIYKTGVRPLLLLAALGVHSLASAQVTLGTAAAFGALAGSTVTNTGPSVVTGDLGVSAGTSVTGFPPGILHGTMHIMDGVALQAHDDVVTAYNVLAGMTPTTNLTGQDLGGMTLVSGVYNFESSAQLTGALVLNAQGNANVLFVFQIGSTLTTGSASSVEVINGGDDCNVYWQVGSSATLGTATEFEGNILALTSITMTTGSSILDGRALALNGAVTLDSNAINACIVPEPGIFVGIGLPILMLAARRRRRSAR